MNKYQNLVVVIAIILITLFTFIPPWEYTFQDQGISQVIKPAGYHLIFKPPSPEQSHEFFGVRLDIKRYLIQIFCVGILSGGFFYLLKEDKH